MGSFRSPKRSFDESDLVTLEWVFESVCTAMQPRDEETKARLRRKLFLLATNGVRDPDALRDKLIGLDPSRAPDIAE